MPEPESEKNHRAVKSLDVFSSTQSFRAGFRRFWGDPDCFCPCIPCFSVFPAAKLRRLTVRTNVQGSIKTQTELFASFYSLHCFKALPKCASFGIFAEAWRSAFPTAKNSLPDSPASEANQKIKPRNAEARSEKPKHPPQTMSAGDTTKAFFIGARRFSAAPPVPRKEKQRAPAKKTQRRSRGCRCSAA